MLKKTLFQLPAGTSRKRRIDKSQPSGMENAYVRPVNAHLAAHLSLSSTRQGRNPYFYVQVALKLI